MKEYYNIANSDIPYELISVTNNIAVLKNKNITVKTNIANIHKANFEHSKKSHTRDYTIKLSSELPSNELMLRHMTRIEALEELDRFMDKTISHHLPQVRIIHGRHGNILRNTVREYLASHPCVLHYEYADLAHGSVGATVATLGYKNNV